MRPDVSRIDLLADPPRAIRVRFEVAATRIAEQSLRRGLLRVSGDDFDLAREFLVQQGWQIEELPGLYVQVAGPAGARGPMTREACVMIALRRLAARCEQRRRSERARRSVAVSTLRAWAEDGTRAALSATADSGSAASPSGWTA